MPDAHSLDPPPPAALAPAVAALSGDLRGILDRLQRLAFRSVQLDARRPELQPESLSTSGRRDLLSALRRRELDLAGLDFLAAPAEFAAPETVDRAVAGALAAVRLAADLGRRPLIMRLPPVAGAAAGQGSGADAPRSTTPGGLIVAAGDIEVLAAATAMSSGPTTSSAGSTGGEAAIDATIIDALAAEADRHGVTLVDLAVPLRRPAGPLVPGLDVAACLAAGTDPMLAMAVAGDRLGSIRLSDLSADGRRVPLGHPEGRLNLAAFAGAVAAGELNLPLVLDPRQTGDHWAGLVAGARAWAEVAP